MLTNMQYEEFLKPAAAAAQLGCKPSDLHRLESLGEIETIRTAGGHRRYNVAGYLERQVDEEIATLDDIRLRVVVAPRGRKLRVYDGIQCQRDKRHRGIAIYRPSDGVLVFLCHHSGCPPHTSIPQKKKKRGPSCDTILSALRHCTPS